MTAKLFLQTSLFVLLTLLTQIGGVAYLLALMINRSGRRKLKTFVLFVGLYAGLSVGTVFVAPVFGRVPLSCVADNGSLFVMRSPVICILNRHYVRPELKAAAIALASSVNEKFPGTVTLALDANFPFIDGFPMLPHLSHKDGRKLDISYYYLGANGEYARGKTKSPVGYWGFEEPLAGTPLPCAGRDDKLTARWDVKWFKPLLGELRLDEGRLRTALVWLVEKGRAANIEKAFIEPHLAERLKVKNDIIRFQGCRAARHDDHLHIQTR
ncbi:FIG00985813: hypothetical protein [hydrothermal vent metagenome]|uniref:Uncharacterized protein n=1 Tax=hydrothermal vent metagenome TaxID=652676 RepID=A0A3B0RXG6_9ZZZZ